MTANYEVSKVNLYEAVAKQLERMILDEVFAVDEKLPSEQQLAGKFSVSRNIVRESLKILKERGLIELRTGDGAYVRKPKSNHLRDVVTRFVNLGDVSYEQVYEMRFALEVAACGLAAERATDIDVDRLEKIIAEMRKNLDKVDMWVELDLAFHCHIARMTGNMLFYTFTKSIAGTLISIFKTGYAAEGACLKGVENHEAIVAALRARDRNEAEKRMRDHLLQSRKNVFLLEDEDGKAILGPEAKCSKTPTPIPPS